MSEAKKPAKLSPKQERFIEEYLIDLNATQAAIRAGYSGKTAYRQGFENLRKPQIESALRERREQLAAKAGVTQERVVAEYAKLAFLDPAQFFDEKGNLLSVAQMPKDVAAALAGFEVVTKMVKTGEDQYEPEHLKKIKFVDKKGALDSLARHLGLFEKDNKQQSGADALKAISDEMKEKLDDIYRQAEGS